MNVYDIQTAGKSNNQIAFEATQILKSQKLTEDEFFVKYISASIPQGGYRDRILDERTNLYDIYRAIASATYIIYDQIYYYMYDFYNIINADEHGVEFWEGYFGIKKNDTYPLSARREFILLHQRGEIKNETYVLQVLDGFGLFNGSVFTYVDSNSDYCGDSFKLPLAIFNNIKKLLLYVINFPNNEIEDFFSSNVDTLLANFHYFDNVIYDLFGHGFVLILDKDKNPIIWNHVKTIDIFKEFTIEVTPKYSVNKLKYTGSSVDILDINNKFKDMLLILQRLFLCKGAFLFESVSSINVPESLIESTPYFEKIKYAPHTPSLYESSWKFTISIVTGGLPVFDIYSWDGGKIWSKGEIGLLTDSGIDALMLNFKKFCNEMEYAKKLYKSMYNEEINYMYVNKGDDTYYAYAVQNKSFFAEIKSYSFERNVYSGLELKIVLTGAGFNLTDKVIEHHSGFFNFMIGKEYDFSFVSRVIITYEA